jgi:hypothetical protein
MNRVSRQSAFVRINNGKRELDPGSEQEVILLSVDVTKVRRIRLHQWPLGAPANVWTDRGIRFCLSLAALIVQKYHFLVNKV